MSRHKTLVKALMTDCALPYGHAIGVLEVLRQNGVQVSMEVAVEPAPSIPAPSIPDTTPHKPREVETPHKPLADIKHPPMNIGQLIALRTILDESQTAFAMRIGVSPPAISRNEKKEKTKLLSAHLLNKIYEADIDPELIEAAKQRAERAPEPEHTATVNRLPHRDAR